MMGVSSPVPLVPATDGEVLVSLPSGRHRAVQPTDTNLYDRYRGRHRGTPQQWYLVPDPRDLAGGRR